MHFRKVKSELKATRVFHLPFCFHLHFSLSSSFAKRHVITIMSSSGRRRITKRHFSNKSKKCQNPNGFLSFFINNPHSAINSHHTVRHGNFHNFHFSFFFFSLFKAWNRKKADNFPIKRYIFQVCFGRPQFSHFSNRSATSNWIFFSLILWQTLCIESTFDCGFEWFSLIYRSLSNLQLFSPRQSKAENVYQGFSPKAIN